MCDIYSHNFSHASDIGDAISCWISRSILGERDRDHPVQGVVGVEDVLVPPGERHSLDAGAAVAHQAHVDAVQPLCRGVQLQGHGGRFIVGIVRDHEREIE